MRDCGILVLSMAWLALGCSHSQTPQPAAPEVRETYGSADVEVVAPEPPPSSVTVTPVPRTPIEGELPTLALNSPTENESLTENVMLDIDVTNWDVGTAPGKHIHLIVDNEPYIALRDVSEPIDLNALLQSTRGTMLTNGTHVVRMFPSRSHHESVKEGSPFVVRVFHFGQPSEDFHFDPTVPLLTYSRPKGCNVVGQPVMLDFYVTGIELSDVGFRVRYTIDDHLHGELHEWTPHHIEGLPVGEHTIRLQLIAGEESPFPGRFNDTTRTITVAESCD